MGRGAKFEYGYDVNIYIQKAVERFRQDYHYHWADKSLFGEQYRYAIEEENGKHHYVRYVRYSRRQVEKEVLDVKPDFPYDKVKNAEDFIARIVSDNEYEMLAQNPKVANYKVQFKPGTDAGGWNLEHYEFNRHKTGDYSAFVQAGDRTTGGSRDFFIPPDYLTGTFEEFLDKYSDLVPGRHFGLYKEDLEKDEGLKKFLGFQ